LYHLDRQNLSFLQYEEGYTWKYLLPDWESGLFAPDWTGRGFLKQESNAMQCNEDIFFFS
jgi:hypothetical protein